MTNQARPLPPPLGEVFRVADARRAGVTSGRLQGRDLERPFHGIRWVADDSPVDPDLSIDEIAREAERRRIRAYSECMGADTFLAGRSAAVHWQTRIGPGDRLIIGVLAPHRARRGAGVHGVKVAPHLAEIREHKGIRVTSPASTWAMLADELSLRELVALGDELVRIPRGPGGALRPADRLATPDELRAAVEAGRRRSISKLREAMTLVREGSSSPLETEYRLDASEGGLPDAELDVEIRTAHGVLLGISEFVYWEQRLAVEVEGDHHRTNRTQWNRDIDKYAAYAAEGWEVVRLTSAHVLRAHRAVGIVRAALIRRGWKPAP
ncbi:hypothetical protein [Microbacterium sp. CJ88]|uniref:hypothetical protein n=1 Tax=Microbacterium sp. CJ88 TaxID=3445672 RepID=UPI003F65A5A5